MLSQVSKMGGMMGGGPGLDSLGAGGALPGGASLGQARKWSKKQKKKKKKKR